MSIERKRFNLFNFWNRLYECWDGYSLTLNQPVLIERFEDAVAYAEKLKANPSLIEEHNKRELDRYNQAKIRREEYIISRYKTKIVK